MNVIERSLIVPYSSNEMFNLVNDIERYPEFLQWCHEAVILNKDEDEIRARLDLSHGGFSKSFTTSNRLQKDKMIEIRLVEGPFRHLEGFWLFESIRDDACKVNLTLEFELLGKMLGLVFGPVFGQIANSLVDSFSKRAVEVYGKR